MPALLHFQQSLHHAVHVHVTLQVIRLVEIALGITFGAPQMDEAHPVTELVHHGNHVIVRTDTERTGAETQTVRNIRHGSHEFPEILGSRKDTRQAENRIRRIVRMDHHFHSALIGHRAYLLQEINQICTELPGIHPVISGQSLPELIQSKAFLAAWQTCDHVSGHQLDLGSIHLLETSLCTGFLCIGIFLFSSRTLEDIKVESHEGILLKTQAPGTVSHLVSQIRPRPVKHRHEIISDTLDTAGGQIPDGLFVILDILLEIPCLGLDMLMHRHAFHYAPCQAVFSDHRLPFLNFLHAPNLSVRNMMERMYYVCDAGLLDKAQAYRIIRSVPAPAFLHQIHNFIFLGASSMQ